jgi:hypothetical protein
MTRRRRSDLMNVDPIEVMFKAMRLQEAVAGREQAKGEAANLKVMADAMLAAASLAEKLASIQDRRGTAPHEPPPKVTVKIIGTCIHCDREFDVDELAPHRNPADKLPRTIDAEVIAPEAAPASAPVAVKALPAVKVEPPKKAFEPAHDFHNGAPLRNGNEPWRNR